MSSVNFYSESSDFFNAILSEIKLAKKSILIESYIFEYFDMTEKLLKALSEAASQGLDVRIILDGFGSLNFLNNHLQVLEKKQIPFRIFNAVPFLFHRWKLTKNSFSLTNILKVGNRRNHRKLVLIDGKIAFIGSQNWSSVHVSSKSQPQAWKDVGCRIEEDDLTVLSKSFEQIWKASRFQSFLRPFKGYVRLKNHHPLNEKFKMNFSFIQRYQIYKYLLKNIRQAKTQIILGSAYFIPKRSFIRALKKAKKRGVDIKIITSGPTDVKVVKLAAMGLYENLLKYQIPLFEYSKSHFHSKYFYFDHQKVLLGSYNMNHRSLMHDLELLYEVSDHKKVSDFYQLIVTDLSHSRQLSLQEIKNRPWYVKLISKVLYRIRYIL